MILLPRRPSGLLCISLAGALVLAVLCASMARPAVAGARAKSAAVSSERVAPRDTDDALPGTPLPPSPMGGTVGGIDPLDIFAVTLSAGETIEVSLSGGGSGDVDIVLYPPGTTDVSTVTNAVASSRATTYPEHFTYTIPRGAGGLYYLCVFAYSGDDSYTLTYAIQRVSRTPDDILPGVPLPSSPFGGTVGDLDPDDIFSVALSAGDMIEVSLAGGGTGDVDVGLYPPGTTDNSTWANAVAVSRGSTYPEYFSYIVPAGEGGTYYLDVYADQGTDSYSVTYSIQATSSPDDALPGVPLPTSSFSGTVGGIDPGDIFSIALSAGETIEVSLSGGGSGDVDVILYPPGTSDVSTVTNAVAASRESSYPEYFSYTAPRGAGGLYYLCVCPYSGSDSYTLSYSTFMDTGRPVSRAMKNVSVVSGQKAALQFKITDPQPSCGGANVTITIKRASRSVQTIRLANVPTNTPCSYSYSVRLAAGRYSWTVKATDIAGNGGALSAAKALTVKRSRAQGRGGLVGTWSSEGWGLARHLTFRANGTFKWIEVTAGQTPDGTAIDNGRYSVRSGGVIYATQIRGTWIPKDAASAKIRPAYENRPRPDQRWAYRIVDGRLKVRCEGFWTDWLTRVN